MTTSARFLVAKYVPDPQRMEPKNIGVVLWASGKIAARFFGDDDEPVRAPGFIHTRNRSVYREWVAYWKQIIKQQKIGDTAQDDPGFLDVLRGRSRDNYVLVDGGVFLAPVKKGEIDSAVEELFDTFVGDEEPKIRLRQVCDRVIRESLDDKSAKDYQLLLKVANTLSHTFTFHYAVPNGKAPHALFQRVDLEQEASVNSATLMFRSAAESGYPSQKCGALIYSTTSNPRGATDMLGAFGQIIDVAQSNAAETIRRISGIKPR